MQTTTRTLLRAAAALAIVAPTAARAQAAHAMQPMRVVAPAADDRADKLAAEAAAQPTELGRFGKIARLYEESAAARAEDDVRVAPALRAAAFYRYYSGNGDATLRLLERAAASALAVGDVVAATNTYIDAALVAVELKQGDRAVDLAARATRLTQSPLLDETQRATLRGRFNNPSEVAFLEQR